MEMELSSLFDSCLWCQLSFRYCVFLFNPSNVQSNGFKWNDWDDWATRVTLSFTYCLSTRTNYRRIGLSRSYDEYIFKRFTLVWRCFTISACVFGYVHVADGITPLAFFTYASGGAIIAFLYRKTHSLYYPILLHLMINITASLDLWVNLFSGS